MEVIYSGDFQYQLSKSQKLSTACIIDIVHYNNGIYCVMMTESKNNKGVSITNICDRIATQVYRRFLKDVRTDKIVWLEHIPASRAHKAHIDLLQFRHQMQTVTDTFTNPQWKRFFESSQITPSEFLKTYEYILKELCGASIIFVIEDKKGYSWRVWANQRGFFILSENPASKIPKRLLDVQGVISSLVSSKHLIGSDIDIERHFTTELIKGFLDKGL